LSPTVTTALISISVAAATLAERPGEPPGRAIRRQLAAYFR
jgi:hypothetical protein